MHRIAFAGLFVVVAAVLAGPPAAAQTRSPGEIAVNGWQVAKKDGACVAYHAYQDKNDDNAANVVSLGLAKGGDGAAVMIVSLFYEK